MENPRRSYRGFEENTMAILDVSGVKDSRDALDDSILLNSHFSLLYLLLLLLLAYSSLLLNAKKGLSFIEAIRAASITSKSGTVPTRKMFDAIFQMLKDGTFLELVMASYQLLLELDKRFPRVYLLPSDEIVVVHEAWSPFIFSSDSSYVEDGTSGNLRDLVDSNYFFLLVQDVAETASKMDSRAFRLKDLQNMLQFQYLVHVLELDFVPRAEMFKANMNWALLRESLIHMLLASRRVSFKSLIKECLSILHKRSECKIQFGVDNQERPKVSTATTVHDNDVALAIEVIELQREMCIAVQKFLALTMEFDVIKKEADKEGLTSRVDGVRTPLVEIILEELTYNKDLLFPFLQASSEPKWKMEIILQYFGKYCKSPSVSTRRSNNSFDASSFEKILKSFTSEANTRNIAHKIGGEVVLMLLAHAFQAHVSLKYGPRPTVKHDGKAEGSPIGEICKDMITAFHNLRKIDKHLEIKPFEKGALFMAGTILSSKS